MDDLADVPQTEAAYQKAITFDEPLPPELFNRYQATIEDLKTRGKRKFQIALGSVAVATLLLTGLVVTWQIRRSYAEKVDTVSVQLRRILDSGELQKANQFIDAVQKSQPELAADPRMAELIAVHSSMTREEEQRVKRFDQQMIQLEAISDQAIDEATLSRLEQEATTDEEKLRVLKQRDRYQRFVDNRRKQHTDSLIGTLREFGDIVNEQSKRQLGNVALDELRAQAANLEGLVDGVKRSLDDFPHASLSAKREAENQVRRISALKTRMKEQEVTLIRSTGATKQVLAARSLKSLKSRMEDYISKLPVDSKSAEFRRTLDSSEFWQTSQLWNLHLRRVQEVFAKRFEPKAVSMATQSGSEFSDVCIAPPMKIPSSVQSCIDRTEKRRAILDQFEAFLDRCLFSQIISIIQDDGQGERVFLYKNHYDSERARFSVGANQKLLSRVEVIQTGDGAIKQETLKTPLKIELEPAASVLTLKAKWKAARSDALADWDGETLKWLASLCRRKELDATIKEILLSQAIEKFMKGSAARDQLAKIRVSLIARRAAWEDWYRPAVLSPRPTDLVVQKIMPALGVVYRDHRDPRKEVRLLNQMRILPVGMWDVVGDSKLSNPSSARIIHFWKPKGSLRSGTLLVVRRDPADPLKCRWIPIGKFEKGQMNVTDPSLDMTAGEPVFLSRGDASSIAGMRQSQSHLLVSATP